jgi:hypothetical protein
MSGLCHKKDKGVTVSLAQVDIRPLKRLASKLLPENSTFRRIIMQENDSMSATDYAAKLGTWLSILDGE